MIFDVYRCLPKKTYSIQDVKTKRVVDHRDLIAIRNGRFRVSEASRQRVIREGRRSVHAKVRGEIIPAPDDWESQIAGMKRLRYNPFTTETFEADGQPITESPLVLLTPKGAFAA